MHPGDRKWWCADKDGDIVDYHKKEVLIENAKWKGEKYAVLSYRKTGVGFKIVEKNF